MNVTRTRPGFDVPIKKHIHNIGESSTALIFRTKIKFLQKTCSCRNKL